MDSRIVRFVVVCLMLGAVTGMAEQSEKEKAAVTAAEKWLGVVDEGKYARAGMKQSSISGMRSSRNSWNNRCKR